MTVVGASAAHTGIALLAGGRSRRLGGSPKACLQIGHTTLLQRVIDACTPLHLPLWLVRASDPPAALSSQLERTGLPQLVDQWPDAGPLGGLATAFTQTPCQRLLLLACDLPFLTSGFLTWLLAQAPTATAVVPSDGNRHHPLCAVYDRASEPVLSERIRRGHLRAHGFLQDLPGVVLLPPAAWQAFDEEGRLLANINNADDLDQARQSVERHI